MASAAAALQYWEQRQTVASNNLANVSTDGFKGQRVFAKLMEGALPAADASTDFTAGSMKPTNAPLDVALEGQGFLVVQTPNGERYSRGGTLRVDENGTLLDPSGNPLLGDHGTIQVGDHTGRLTGNLTITTDGTVHVGKTEVGHLRVEAADPQTVLAREGAGLYVPPATRSATSLPAPMVRQGTLEESNVTPTSQMVDMIDIQRAYTAVQKAMSTIDAARGIATTQLGQPTN